MLILHGARRQENAVIPLHPGLGQALAPLAQEHMMLVLRRRARSMARDARFVFVHKRTKCLGREIRGGAVGCLGKSLEARFGAAIDVYFY